MPLSHDPQKRLAKHMKNRLQLKRREQTVQPVLLRSASALLHAALELPVGPSFVSDLWAGSPSPGVEGEDGVPTLVMVVVTRITPWGSLIPTFVLVDRTCMGVKSALLGAPRTRAELDEDLALLADAHGPIAPCPLVLVQSVVLHAIEYARTLGFEPHESFPAALFDPRPEELLDTPFSKPRYPIYIVAPGDQVESVLETLDRAVGPFNYSFMSFEPMSGRGSAAYDEDERDDDDDNEAPAAVG